MRSLGSLDLAESATKTPFASRLGGRSRFWGRPLLSWSRSSPGKFLLRVASVTPITACGGSVTHARTKGRPGGKQPLGNLAVRSPPLSLSAATRKAARKRP